MLHIIPPCPVPLPTKTCSACGETKDLTEFNNNRSNRDGKCYRCRQCQSTYHREYYVRNPELFKAKQERDRVNYADRNREYRNKSENKAKAAKRVREWHARNPEKASEWHVKKYQTVEGRAYALFNAARRRIPEGFSLTLAHVVKELSKGFCPVTGIAFDLAINNNGRKNRSWTPNAPSIDKIDPLGGYTDENTRIVTWQYNIMKNVFTDEQVFEICRLISDRHPK